MAALMKAASRWEVVEARAERHWKVMARAILDGFPVGPAPAAIPNAGSLVERARQGHETKQAARITATNTMALELRWRLFEPFLRSATGLEGVPESKLRGPSTAKPAGSGNPTGVGRLFVSKREYQESLFRLGVAVARTPGHPSHRRAVDVFKSATGTRR
jgi:hypothetical protein